MAEPVNGARYLKPAASDAGAGPEGLDDRRVLHRAGLLERALDGRDRRALLADGDVDAPDLLGRVARLPVLLLVDDRVDRDGGLARLAVADDQLALAAADRRHRVDGLQARLHRLVDRLALDDRRGLELERTTLGRGDLTETVDRLAERVHDAAEVGVADGDRQDLARALDRLALLDAGEVTEDDDTDLVHVEVERDAERAVLELEQLVGHRRGQPLDVGDAVTGVDDAADLFARRGARVVGLHALASSASRISSGRIESSVMCLFSSCGPGPEPAVWVAGGGVSRRGAGGRLRACERPCRR